jgi:hypothetical protein
MGGTLRGVEALALERRVLGIDEQAILVPRRQLVAPVAGEIERLGTEVRVAVLREATPRRLQPSKSPPSRLLPVDKAWSSAKATYQHYYLLVFPFDNGSAVRLGEPCAGLSS